MRRLYSEQDVNKFVRHRVDKMNQVISNLHTRITMLELENSFLNDNLERAENKIHELEQETNESQTEGSDEDEIKDE